MASFKPLTSATEGAVDVVVNAPPVSVAEEPRRRAEDSCLYWLSCICCNCFGFGFIAFIFHYVAKSLFESGSHHRGAANSLWKRARFFRKLGVIITLILIIVYVAYVVLIMYYRFHAGYEPDDYSNDDGQVGMDSELSDGY
eukprot:60628_1